MPRQQHAAAIAVSATRVAFGRLFGSRLRPKNWLVDLLATLGQLFVSF